MSVRWELYRTFGGLNSDVEAHFFKLSPDQLERLFRAYERDYGRSAASYARNAYLKWRSGQVRLSGTTAERLLHLVPPLLPLNSRFELVREFLQARFIRVDRTIRTTMDRWRQDLLPVVDDVVGHGATLVIPAPLKQRVAWLAGPDVALVEDLLIRAAENEAIQRIQYLEAEFVRLETLIKQRPGGSTSISHVIALPQGCIYVYIEIPKQPLALRIKKWLGEWL